jgi:hypothetical protein
MALATLTGPAWRRRLEYDGKGYSPDRLLLSRLTLHTRAIGWFLHQRKSIWYCMHVFEKRLEGELKNRIRMVIIPREGT